MMEQAVEDGGLELETAERSGAAARLDPPNDNGIK